MSYVLFNKVLSFFGWQTKWTRMLPKIDEKFLLIYHHGKSASHATFDGIMSHPELDYNVYVLEMEKSHEPLILFSPVSEEKCLEGFESLKSLNDTYPKFEYNGKLFDGFLAPLFQGKELKNFRLLSNFNGAELPKQIKKILGHEVGFVGAYPPSNK